MIRWKTRSLAGVLIFSVLAGVTSGCVTAAGFMPVYSVHYNWKRWFPGTETAVVLGTVDGASQSRVLYASDWEDLRASGLPASRLWRYSPAVAQEPGYALVAHGIWTQQGLQLGDAITLNLEGGPVTVPVAGVWHPFHPQLGDNWAVLVGETSPAAAVLTQTDLPQAEPVGNVLPPGFRGWNLLSWLLFNTLGFLLYGAAGLIDIRGRIATLGWAAKLWVGGGTAVVTGLLTAALVFRAFLPLPVMGLLPMTLGMLIAGYLLAVLLLTGLSILLSRFA